MANEATVAGASAKVENIDDLDADIMAEQQKLAASAAADPTADTTATPAVPAVPAVEEPVAVKGEELTPAAKQAALADDQGEISIDMFKAQKNKVQTLDKGVKPAAQLPSTQATPAAAATPTPRDLTALPPEYHELGKKMSNEAFAEFTKVVKERQQLGEQLAEVKKGALPDSYYEHEQAYVLTPEFATASDAVSQTEQVLQHWSAQADALAGGADTYTTLVQGANGQLVPSAPIQADRTTASQISRAVTWAQQQYMQAQAQLQAVGQVHRTKAAETKQWINNFDKTAFRVFEEKPELKAVVADTKAKMLHKSLQGNPMADLFAKAVILLDYQAKAIAQLQTGGGNASVQQNGQQTVTPKAAAQPSAAAIAGGGAAPKAAKGNESEVTMDDFFKAKKGLL
jgi:hypothetical protein